jgi:hypothetical protein
LDTLALCGPVSGATSTAELARLSVNIPLIQKIKNVLRHVSSGSQRSAIPGQQHTAFASKEINFTIQ